MAFWNVHQYESDMKMILTWMWQLDWNEPRPMGGRHRFFGCIKGGSDSEWVRRRTGNKMNFRHDLNYNIFSIVVAVAVIVVFSRFVVDDWDDEKGTQVHLNSFVIRCCCCRCFSIASVRFSYSFRSSISCHWIKHFGLLEFGAHSTTKWIAHRRQFRFKYSLALLRFDPQNIAGTFPSDFVYFGNFASTSASSFKCFYFKQMLRACMICSMWQQTPKRCKTIFSQFFCCTRTTARHTTQGTGDKATNVIWVVSNLIFDLQNLKWQI